MPNLTLSPPRAFEIDAYWRAANYLTVGQIYLKANPLDRHRADIRQHLEDMPEIRDWTWTDR